MKNRILTSALTLLISSGTYATNDLDFRTTISFSNPSEATHIVSAAYANIYKIHSQLLTLRETALKAANETTTDRASLDKNFQNNLNALNELIKNDSSFSFDNIFQGTTYIKYIDQTLVLGFNISDFDISKSLPAQLTKDNAYDCLQTLYYAQNQAEQSLPKSDQIEELLKFTTNINEANSALLSNRLYIKKEDGKGDLLQRLIALRKDQDNLISDMKNVAQKATEANSADIHRLNDQFQQLKDEFTRLYNDSSLFLHMSVFNNNSLEFTLNNKSYSYYFPTLALNKNQSKPINVLSAHNAKHALKKIDKMLNNIDSWTVEHS